MGDGLDYDNDDDYSPLYDDKDKKGAMTTKVTKILYGYH